MGDKKLIRLSGIALESLSNGPGMRRVFFSQGCIHECKNCFNPGTHSFSAGVLRDMDELIKDIGENPMLRGITFSGGDPFEQATKFAYMGQKIKAMSLNIWCYTGYTYEYILRNRYSRIGWKDLLSCIDVLVDGKFKEDKKVPGLRFRGSENQRIIDVKESLKLGYIIILNQERNI